jgi:hypothetical protein
MLPVPNPKVLFKSMSDGAVLFSTDNEVYFGLNSVGARIWELLPPVCATFEELCTRLASEYPEVTRHVIETDVKELLSDLTTHKLVAVRAEGQSDQSIATRVPAQAGKA